MESLRSEHWGKSEALDLRRGTRSGCSLWPSCQQGPPEALPGWRAGQRRGRISLRWLQQARLRDPPSQVACGSDQPARVRRAENWRTASENLFGLWNEPSLLLHPVFGILCRKEGIKQLRRRAVQLPAVRSTGTLWTTRAQRHSRQMTRTRTSTGSIHRRDWESAETWGGGRRGWFTFVRGRSRAGKRASAAEAAGGVQ